MNRKQRKKQVWKQCVSWLLCITMMTPTVAPIAAEAATGLANMPRYVDFTRPQALTMQDLRLSTGSNQSNDFIPDEDAWIPDEDDWILDEDEMDGYVHTATDSDAELREPEFFYDTIQEEPDGILVDFSETSRTYLVEENVDTDEAGEPIHTYVTVVGKNPTMYRDSDGFVRYNDDTLMPVTRQAEKLTVASGSNARMARSITTTTTYRNAEGEAEIQIPDEMDKGTGYMISNGEETLEIIPTEGSYKNSIVLDNVIRYSDVFEGIDVQYTVIGNMVKEDIILLEPQERNEFSYRLESTGLKYRKVDQAVVAYRDSYRDPVFRITAPVMVDAEGRTSVDVAVRFDKGSNKVTFCADEDWLKDADRAYPVRIDPGAELIGYDAFTVNMVAKGDNLKYAGTGQNDPEYYFRHFGGFPYALVGHSEIYGHCRAVIGIDTAWESLINHSATQVDGPGVKHVQFSIAPFTETAVQNTPFTLRVMDEEWDQSTVSYASICHKKSTQTGDAAYSEGKDVRLEFDITDAYYGWVNNTKPRNGLIMEVEEGTYRPGELDSVWWAETFYNETALGNGPRIEVTWQGQLQADKLKTMPMSECSLDVGAGVVETDAGGRSTRGILAHGASQEDSRIEYTVYEKDGDAVTDGEVRAHGEIDCPDYREVDDDCIWEKYQDSNWQSDPVLYGSDLELDTIYYVKAQGTGRVIEEDPETGEPTPGTEEEKSPELTSDEFLLYEVQAIDIIPRIARHYGVSIRQLKEDNQFREQLTVAGDVLFVRNPKTTEPYTRKLTPHQMEELLLECLSLGMDYRDFFDMEPVNMANGSFYMSQTDARIPDLGGDFAITRSYNSVTPYFRSEFGYGWNSLAGEKIMVLQDGRVIYNREDGKGLIFEKSGDRTYQAPEGYDYELKPVNSLEVMTEDASPEADDEESEGDREELTAPVATASVMSYRSLAEAAEEGAEEDAEGTEGDEAGADDVEAVPPSTGWEITQPDGTVKQFNSNGLLVTEKDRKGYTTYYVYDSAFSLKRIVSPSGKEYGITQTPQGIITDIALPDGGELHYEYDEADNLIAVTNPEGGVRRYEYDDEHHMTAWQDENGSRIVENRYDEKGRIITQEDALGNTATLEYGDGLTRMTDNRGNTTEYRFNGQRLAEEIVHPNGDRETISYTEENRVASRTDANGATTRYTYDASGNVLIETREDGSKASYSYNEDNLPLTATDYEGNTTRFTYDEKGNLLSMTDGGREHHPVRLRRLKPSDGHHRCQRRRDPALLRRGRSDRPDRPGGPHQHLHLR